MNSQIPQPVQEQTFEEKLAEMEARKDAAYLERNRVVAAFARACNLLGYGVGLQRTAIEGWNEEWHNCVYLDLPTGQVSWHYHDSHAHLFTGLPPYVGAWDGHTTPQKYERLHEFTTTMGRRHSCYPGCKHPSHAVSCGCNLNKTRPEGFHFPDCPNYAAKNSSGAAGAQESLASEAVGNVKDAAARHRALVGNIIEGGSGECSYCGALFFPQGQHTPECELPNYKVEKP